MHFKDVDTAQKILQSTDPREQKALGRVVRGYNDFEWKSVCREIMKMGVILKFQQNVVIQRKLLSTSTILVEASKYDGYWGCGRSADDPLAKSCTTWKGTNYLGLILTEVREILRQHRHE